MTRSLAMSVDSLPTRITLAQSLDAGPARAGDFVFRPRSDLLLSAELRRLRTFPVYSSSVTNQLNLSVGMLF